ncbi:putative cytochrome P450 6a13 [Zootermopsis nevadensis]|uniref:Putative cytochrome P450 6a13 n=1 Tax=Zootermopsis nevadensis TaxID=136037 RepID=A0A067QE09_ZOONE|nr:putative cytochrome P450 6a13 [Zootermopsis nevadensis]
MTMDEIAAQVFVFFIAGFETSSATMSYCLYELALNPDVQQRVRDEVDTVLQKHGGAITYEAIQEMEYLDKAVAGEIRPYLFNPRPPRVDHYTSLQFTRQCI